MISLLLLAVGLIPPTAAIDDSVDVIEMNHYYDSNGKLIFRQAIFWNWSPADSAHCVTAWRIVKTPDLYPRRDNRRGGYVAIWSDGQALRIVRCCSWRQSHTLFDPELANRTLLPPVLRRGLTKGGRP